MSELDVAFAPIDVFITDELRRRAPRATDYRIEKLALQRLAGQMITHPADVLPHLVDLALEICGSVSGGISLYEDHPAPGVFRWHNLRGGLSGFSGATTPRDFSPCGICLDRSEPTLTRRPERVYTWLVDANISLAEVLLVPLYVGEARPLGTLWVVSENEGHFDSGHARVLAELAVFAGMAVYMQRTERQLQESLEQQEMLTMEMSHRIKNLFMLVSGMIHVSARSASSPKEMGRILSGRLRALAEANALVRPTFHDAGPVRQVTDLAELIGKVLAPHEGAAMAPGRNRFQITGPPVHLGERAANGFALVCHELATNAAKYGALKNRRGVVRVSWQERQNGDLSITWRERGGPVVAAPPMSSGFGIKLANQTIVGQFGGSLSYDWQSEGLSITLSVPLKNLST